MINENCPCKKKNCPRHGDCEACRIHHAASNRKRPVYCDRKISLRKFRCGDEFAVADVIRTTLTVSNIHDYPAEYIRDNIESHSPEVIAERAADSHFYVVVDGKKIIGCGRITGYWGSTTESYLVSVFVLPEYQRKGIGRRIVEVLEADEYFLRAWRTEVGSSLTAVNFYLKMGYEYKNGITSPDKFGVIRLEKKKTTNHDLYDIDSLVSLLFDKNNNTACTAMKTLCEISERTDTAYCYMNTFAQMLKSDNSYVRNRGIKLIAANARWDKDFKIDEIIEEYLKHIEDIKPITARQCISSLPQIASCKPDLKEDILSALKRADTSHYPDSMRNLVQNDIKKAIQDIAGI